MKIIAIFTAAVLMTACGPTSNPVVITTPPAAVASPNQKLILALDGMLIACEALSPNVSPAAEAWIIPGCPNAVESVIAALNAGSTAAQVQIAVTGIQTFLANAPKNGLSPQDSQIIQSVLGATQAFLIVYQQQAVATATTVYTGGFAFAGPQKLTLTKAEKAKLKEIKKRADALRKRKK